MSNHNVVHMKLIQYYMSTYFFKNSLKKSSARRDEKVQSMAVSLISEVFSTYTACKTPNLIYMDSEARPPGFQF